MKIYSLLLVILFFIGCNTNQKSNAIQEEISWAVRFADAVIHESDSLIYYKREKPKYEYDYAFLASAINKLSDIDEKYSDYARAYIDYFVQDDGSINGYKLSDYNIDRVRPGLNILHLYKQSGEEKYLRAVQLLVSQMEAHPRTESKGFWHKKRYPWQMWLDGIYMAHPMLTEYASTFDKAEWFDVLAYQIQLIYEKTLDTESGLLYHGWDESREQKWSDAISGQSSHFWSRGMGWYLMALVDVLDYFPEDHSQRPAIIEILNNTCDALLKVRDPEKGLWFQVLDMGGMDGNYLESSGSSMIIYAYAKGARKGYLPNTYLEIANNAFDCLVEELVIDGKDGYPILTNACGAAGLGGDPYRMGDYEYYINELKVNNDQKAVAPLILAAIELGK